MGGGGEPVTGSASPETLGPALLSRLPPAVQKAVLRPGIAHIGVGAFHRCFAGWRGLADWIAANHDFRTTITAALGGLLSDDPMALVRQVCALPAATRLKRPAQSA